LAFYCFSENSQLQSRKESSEKLVTVSQGNTRFPQPGSLLTINGEFTVIWGEMQILDGSTKNGPDKSRAVYYQDWSIIFQEIL